MSINLVGGENSTYSLIKQGIKASTARAKTISRKTINVSRETFGSFRICSSIGKSRIQFPVHGFSQKLWKERKGSRKQI